MEDDQQFCLRWNNHQTTLVEIFDKLLRKGILVDCTLAAEGKYLDAHRVVLTACSPYFEALLSRHYDKHPILVLPNVKFQELKAMMDYMYRGEVNISQDQLGALLKAAESLQIRGLSDNKREERNATAPAAAPPPPRSPPPPPLPRTQGLSIEQNRQQHRNDARSGSKSPGPRKRRRHSEEMENHHDGSNSSESHSLPAQNIPSTLPLSSEVPDTVETKQEILTRPRDDTQQTQISASPQVPTIKEKLETHTELILEPKSEYVEEINEDSIEDLTLDDDDLSNMEQMDEAGPSHAGEGTSQQDWYYTTEYLSSTSSSAAVKRQQPSSQGGSKNNDLMAYVVDDDDDDDDEDNYDHEIDMAPLYNQLYGRIRKYSEASIGGAIDAILNKGVTVTKASSVYGIKRTSLQHYLKKLNIKLKYNG